MLDVVKIRAKSPDPLEVHRVIPALGMIAVLCFAIRARHTSRSSAPRSGASIDSNTRNVNADYSAAHPQTAGA